MKLEYKILCDRDDNLVFATPERVKYVARIWDAVENSSTWAEFRHAIPRDEYFRVMLLSFDDRDIPRPKGSDRFDRDAIRPCIGDGDYPPTLFNEMFHGTLPFDLVPGCILPSAQGGCFLYPSGVASVKRELERRRYKLTPAIEYQMFHGVLPGDILRKYGECEINGVHQVVCTIAYKYLDEIRTELERRGYELIDGSEDESFLW
jgi:hypothetical protein